MMPGMSGIDLHTALLPDQAKKFVFMTGGAFTEATSRFLAQVSNPSIEKPLKASKLRSLVRALVQ